MKPADLKLIAKKFTLRFYPDWINRTDRIWTMFEGIELSPAHSNDETPSYLQGIGLGMAGAIDSESKEFIGGIAVLAFAYQDVKDKTSVSEDEIKEKISVISLDSKLPAGIQEKLQSVLNDILPTLISGHQANKHTDINVPGSDKSYILFVSRESGFGAQKLVVTEDELHNDFLSKKEEYDIIVYKQNVEIKNENSEFLPLDLYSNILKLLVVFLKYKDESLPFLELYHCAWKGGAEYRENIRDPYEIIDDLKTGVSSLRKLLEPVQNFKIPNAKRKSNTYTCRGNFQFCLILSESMSQNHTLLVG